MQDKEGNALFRQGDIVFLKLSSENRSRKLGSMNDELGIFYTYRNPEKHLYRKLNAYGFNFEMLKVSQKIKTIVITTSDKEKIFCTLEDIKEHGIFLHHKKEGFEKQIFLKLEYFKPYKS